MKKVFLICMLASRIVFAWGDDGHKMIGSIAENVMSQDAKKMIQSILGVEPLYIAAIWPDLVRDDDVRFSKRDDEVFDFSPFHFCEVPVGFTYSTRPVKNPKDCNSVLSNTQKILLKKTASRQEKMIALRFLVHVVGDIHQPLHVGNGFDRGANLCYIKTSEQARYPKTLHGYWDSTTVDDLQASFNEKDKPPLFYGQFFKLFLAKHKSELTEANKVKFGSTNVISWLDEAKDLRETAYPDTPESMKGAKPGEEYKFRSYCTWMKDQVVDKEPAPGAKTIEEAKASAVVLSSEFRQKSIHLTEEQIIKGGLRLAYLLDRIGEEFKKSRQGKKDANLDEKKILESIQKTYTQKF